MSRQCTVVGLVVLFFVIGNAIRYSLSFGILPLEGALVVELVGHPRYETPTYSNSIQLQINLNKSWGFRQRIDNVFILSFKDIKWCNSTFSNI